MIILMLYKVSYAYNLCIHVVIVFIIILIIVIINIIIRWSAAKHGRAPIDFVLIHLLFSFFYFILSVWIVLREYLMEWHDEWPWNVHGMCHKHDYCAWWKDFLTTNAWRLLGAILFMSIIDHISFIHCHFYMIFDMHKLGIKVNFRSQPCPCALHGGRISVRQNW